MIEGFDNLDVAYLQLKQWVYATNGGDGVAPGVTTGRLGGQAFYLTGGFNDRNIAWTHPLVDTTGTVTIGFAYLLSGASNTSSVTVFSTTGTMFSFAMSGNTPLIRNSAGTTVITGTPIAYGTWNYVEIQCVKGATGTIEYHLNGALIGGPSVSNFGTGNANNLQLFHNRSGQTSYYDDMYFLDNAGTLNNTFLGDVRVETLMPTGVGNQSDWTRNGGAANWDRVDEIPPDGDTTYNAASVVGDVDTYVFADPTPSSGTVFGLQTNLTTRKTDAGVRTTKAVTRVGGTDYDGAATAALATGYSVYTEIQEQDPTAVDWTLASVAAAEFGVKVES